VYPVCVTIAVGMSILTDETVVVVKVGVDGDMLSI